VLVIRGGNNFCSQLIPIPPQKRGQLRNDLPRWWNSRIRELLRI